MADKTKVLAYCDFACATGFSTVAQNVLVGLHNTGQFDITVLGINYHGQPHQFPFPVWPVGVMGSSAGGGMDPYGRKWSTDMMLKMDYDILFTLQDSFILTFMGEVVDRIRAKNSRVKWINYFPVDATPKKEWLEIMAKADFPVTYTNWGKRLCDSVTQSFGDRLSVIYHGINTKDFFPMPASEAETFRKMFFGEHANKFVISNINRNQQRKDIPRSMQAFKKFKQSHPNSLYYCHCAVVDHGWHLLEVSKAMGLEVNKDIAFPSDFGPNQGYPTAIVNNIYNASDVVISSTTGEGWGLAQTEAMACCKPVISPDNTSCSEILAEDRGFLVRSGWNSNAFTVLPNDNEVLRPLTDIDDLVDKLESVYSNKELRDQVALNGYKWAVSSLKWDKHIVPKWVDIFNQAVKSSKDSAFPGKSKLSFIEL